MISGDGTLRALVESKSRLQSGQPRPNDEQHTQQQQIKPGQHQQYQQHQQWTQQTQPPPLDQQRAPYVHTHPAALSIRDPVYNHCKYPT